MFDEPFALSAAELRAIAAEGKPPHPVDLILERHDVEFDEQGRAHTRLWRIYAIRDERYLGAVGAVRATWAPWFQDPPEIRARVLAAHEERWLDPTDLMIRDEEMASPILYGDRKTIAAPLPQVGLGSIVEVTIRTRNHGVQLEAGTALEYPLRPCRRFEIHAKAPQGLPMHCAGRGADDVPAVLVEDGLKRWSVRHDDLEMPRHTDLVPPDWNELPVYAIGTADSWDTVARDYADLVEGVISEPPAHWVEKIVDAPDDAAKDRGRQ